ncbi:hypothetical protein HGRIS_005140 [Hohenbuehelia grisea]|uniref:Cell wall protein n=1 Tax=Hohenbuehelia grisea TaxID=104357 RepID=A0ABR3JFJ2_9AGAR
MVNLTLLTVLLGLVYVTLPVGAKPIQPATSGPLLNRDLSAINSAIEGVGECIKGLPPPTVAKAMSCVSHITFVQAAFENLAADLNNATLSLMDAIALVKSLGDVTSNLHTSLPKVGGAYQLFLALEAKDDEGFSLDDLAEALGDSQEQMDDVFSGLKKVLPTADLKKQAKDQQQKADTDFEQTIAVFKGSEAKISCGQD